MIESSQITTVSITFNLILILTYVYHVWPTCDTDETYGDFDEYVSYNSTVNGVETVITCGNPLRKARMKFFKHMPTSQSNKFHGKQYEWAFYKYFYPHSFGRPKLLEIGRECGSYYGPSASVEFWLKYFDNNVDLWVYEADKTCAEAILNMTNSPNVKVVIGDQADPHQLSSLITAAGGQFDLIVEDGGHSVYYQTVPLRILFPHLKSGGSYFILDINADENVDPHAVLLRNVILEGVQKPRPEDGPPTIDPLLISSLECFRGICVFNKV